MPIRPFATNNNLLAYGLSSEPDPIGISPGVATINIAISNTTSEPIWCNRIMVQYPAGKEARDLTNDPGTIQGIVAPDTWRVISKTDGLITFGPAHEQYAKITSDGLLFQLTGIAVNDKIGTFILGIDEHSHTGDGNYQKHHNEYLISKFPYGWFMTDLAPRTALVEHGRPAILDWQASAEGVFEIFYGSHGPVDVSSGPPFTSEPLDTDTVFILKASLQVGGETVYHYLTTAIAVAHPVLDASSLTVAGWSALKGGAEITGDARVTGAASVGSLSSAGTATVSGALAANSVRSGGPLEAEGPATLKSSLTVDAQSTVAALLVRGLLQATGRTSLFGRVRTVNPGTYRAVTDGLVIGAVSKGGDNPTQLSVAWVSRPDRGLRGARDRRQLRALDREGLPRLQLCLGVQPEQLLDARQSRGRLDRGVPAGQRQPGQPDGGPVVAADRGGDGRRDFRARSARAGRRDLAAAGDRHRAGDHHEPAPGPAGGGHRHDPDRRAAGSLPRPGLRLARHRLPLQQQVDAFVGDLAEP